MPGDNRQQARKLVAALAHYMGGRSYYLPSGDRLMNALRDDQIYSRFDGRNVEQLRRAYGLGQTQIYTIIAQQRALHVRRAQPDLFLALSNPVQPAAFEKAGLYCDTGIPT